MHTSFLLLFQFLYNHLNTFHNLIISLNLHKYLNYNNHLQKDISLEEKDYELSIHFLKTYTNNRAEDQLFQMLYAISIDQIVDDKTLRIWVENDFEKIIKWENDYLKDMKNKLRQEHHFVDDCYSLDIYEDLKRLLGYEKYLDGYKENEYLVHSLFLLKKYLFVHSIFLIINR